MIHVQANVQQAHRRVPAKMMECPALKRKIQHASYGHRKSLALLRWEGDRAVRLGSQMYTHTHAHTQTTAVRVCLQYSLFLLMLKTTIHKTQIPMRSLGAELEEELMTLWGGGRSSPMPTAARPPSGEVDEVWERVRVIVIVLLVEVLGMGMAIMLPAHIPDIPPEVALHSSHPQVPTTALSLAPPQLPGQLPQASGQWGIHLS